MKKAIRTAKVRDKITSKQTGHRKGDPECPAVDAASPQSTDEVPMTPKNDPSTTPPVRTVLNFYPELPWHEETMRFINTLVPEVKGKAFNPDWFLLRQHFEEAERLMLRWLPIETAPKDSGKDLLLFCPHLGVVSGGRWDADVYSKTPKPFWTHHGGFLWGKTHIRSDQPTHWMPLPDPPPPDRHEPVPPANTEAVK